MHSRLFVCRRFWCLWSRLHSHILFEARGQLTILVCTTTSLSRCCPTLLLEHLIFSHAPSLVHVLCHGRLFPTSGNNQYSCLCTLCTQYTCSAIICILFFLKIPLCLSLLLTCWVIPSLLQVEISREGTAVL